MIHYAPRFVLPYRPRLIVLYGGDNDLADGQSPATVFRDYQAFVALTPMLGPDGTPCEELFVADRLHMSARGYALWRDLLAPIVRDTAR